MRARERAAWIPSRRRPRSAAVVTLSGSTLLLPCPATSPLSCAASYSSASRISARARIARARPCARWTSATRLSWAASLVQCRTFSVAVYGGHCHHAGPFFRRPRDVRRPGVVRFAGCARSALVAFARCSGVRNLAPASGLPVDSTGHPALPAREQRHPRPAAPDRPPVRRLGDAQARR